MVSLLPLYCPFFLQCYAYGFTVACFITEICSMSFISLHNKLFMMEIYRLICFQFFFFYQLILIINLVADITKRDNLKTKQTFGKQNLRKYVRVCCT